MMVKKLFILLQCVCMLGVAICGAADLGLAPSTQIFAIFAILFYEVRALNFDI